MTPWLVEGKFALKMVQVRLLLSSSERLPCKA
jgi:hypothetical protein